MPFCHVFEGNHHGARSLTLDSATISRMWGYPSPVGKTAADARGVVQPGLHLHTTPQRIVVFGAPHVQTLEVVVGSKAARAVKLSHAISVRAAP